MSQDFFFHAPQGYMVILEYARKLIRHESDRTEESRIQHQINTRLYNNAFCGLLKAGAPFKVREDHGKEFITMEIEDICYECPASSASNILRSEYGGIILESQNQVTEKRDTERTEEVKNKGIKSKTEKEEKVTSPFLMKSGLPDMDSFEFSPPKKHKIRDIGEEAGKGMCCEENDHVEKGMVTASHKRRDEPESKGEDLAPEQPVRFVPKNERFRQPVPAPQNTKPVKEEEDGKAGILSGLFGRKKKEEESSGTVEAERKEGRNYHQDGGVPFMHIHYVALKRRFGDEVIANYCFIFWPTRIVEQYPKKTWGDFLIHVTNMDTMEETITCTDHKMKELTVEADQKEFSVFCFWNAGVFESHVVLRGKTDSMFRMEEKIDKKEPEDMRDSYLEQFRYEKKGQPKLFVAPFRGNNRGERQIPILGCVEIHDQKFPLERLDKNRIGYRCHGELKIIQGHWEKGSFVFTIEDGDPIEWEEYL